MSDFFLDSTTQLTARGRVKTSSFLYKTWLALFRGYSVERTVQTPKRYAMGRLTYQKSWVLKPPNPA